MAILDDNVYLLDVAEVAQTQPERLDSSQVRGRGGSTEESHPGDSRRRLRLGQHSATGQQTETSQDQASLQDLTTARASHWMISVAWFRTDCGIVSPRI